MDALDTDKLANVWGKLDESYTCALAAIGPIDFGKKLRSHFKDIELIRNTGQYQINKYALLHCLGKPTVSHPSKGMNGRGHIMNILNRVDTLPNAKQIFEASDAELLSRCREICTTLSYVLPQQKANTQGTDVD